MRSDSVRLSMAGLARKCLVVGALCAGAIALPALAQPMGPAGHAGQWHHGMGMDGAHSPERMARHIDHMLDGLKATDAQRSQIKQIAQAAATDIKAQHAAGKALHERATQLLTAPTVDAAAIEAVRQQMLQHHDQVSRRMTQALVDAANVLTPEQRAKLAQRMQDRRDSMKERMRRMHPGN